MHRYMATRATQSCCPRSCAATQLGLNQRFYTIYFAPKGKCQHTVSPAYRKCPERTNCLWSLNVMQHYVHMLMIHYLLPFVCYFTVTAANSSFRASWCALGTDHIRLSLNLHLDAFHCQTSNMFDLRFPPKQSFYCPAVMFQMRGEWSW